MKILTLTLLVFQTFINLNMLLGYIMVKFLDVKVDSVPIEKGFYLIGLTMAMSYVLLSMLLLLAIIWRFKSVGDATLELESFKDKRILLKKVKTVTQIWSKLGDLLTSVNKYFLTSNIFLFTIIFMMFLITLFLGYDIFMHSLGSDDLVLFYSFVIFTLSYTLCGLIIIFSSVYFSNSFSKVFKNLNSIRLKNNDEKIWKICTHSILQLDVLHNEISCGLFSLNWKFVFLMISSCFAYLVMMIQFDFMLTIQNIQFIA